MAVGLAVTVEPVVAESPVDGDHIYVFAPEAVNVVEPGLQIAVVPAMATVGSGFTVTTMVSVSEHPLAVSVCVTTN